MTLISTLHDTWMSDPAYREAYEDDHLDEEYYLDEEDAFDEEEEPADPFPVRIGDHLCDEDCRCIICGADLVESSHLRRLGYDEPDPPCLVR